MADPARAGRTPVVAVMGNGGWGTALALVAARNEAEVRLWGIDPDYVAETAESRVNSRYLPGVTIPPNVLLTSDADAAFAGADVVMSVVPTQFLRKTASALASAIPPGVPIVSCSKGIERGTHARPTEVLAAVLGQRSLGVLSGPNHAEEVARGAPASAVVASTDQQLCETVQLLFSDEGFRLYSSSDVLGVELAAALKNVIALAAGMIDGLELGDNAKAALLTRGNAEITRLGRALGAQTETFFGLAGIGDLIATCVSPHGRNRGVGARLGRGETLTEILSSMVQVAEGVETTRSVVPLASAAGVEMPITEIVHRILFEDLSPRLALTQLMTRQLRSERDDPREGDGT